MDTSRCGENDPEFFSEGSRIKILKSLINFKSSFISIHAYLAACICLFGIVTNIIHIFVLTRKSMRNNAVNCLLTAVALCDLGTMVSYFLYLIHFALSYDNQCQSGQSYTWMVVAVIHGFLSVYLHHGSLWLVILLAFMRLMSIRRRTWGSPWQKPDRALKLGFLVSLMVTILTLPNLLLQNITELEIDKYYCTGNINHSNTTVKFYRIMLSDIAAENGCRLLKIELFIVGILFKVIPCIILGVLSTHLVSSVRKRHVIRKNLRRYSPIRNQLRQNSCFSKTDSATVTLIAILLVFLITEFPQGILTIGGAIYTQDIYFFVYGAVADLLDLMSLINSCINFLLYCLLSSQYRKTFCQAVCFCTGNANGRRREKFPDLEVGTSLIKNTNHKVTLQRTENLDDLQLHYVT